MKQEFIETKKSPKNNDDSGIMSRQVSDTFKLDAPQEAVRRSNQLSNQSKAIQ